MYCGKCGNLISEGAKFCGRCGAPVPQKQTPKKICPNCGAEFESAMVFCEHCGTKLTAGGRTVKPPVDPPRKTDTVSKAAEQTVSAAGGKEAQNPYVATGKMVTSANGITYYKGEPMMSPSGQVGKLTIYDDHLEFKVLSGGFGKGLLSIGKSFSFPMKEIVGVKEGKYGGLCPSVVILLKNGEKHSFVAVSPASKRPAELAAAIMLYAQTVNTNF